MIAQQPVVERLKAAGLQPVEGVLEFVALTEAPRASPAFFVAPERESAAPNRMAGVVDQKVAATFSVIIVVRAARRAGAVSDELKAHCDAVVDALLGWRHPESSSPCEYAGGRLLSVEGQHLSWALSFTASRHIRKESQ